MPDRQPSQSAADRNLLFGVLALQMDFISREQLVSAMQAWVFDKAKPLGQIFIEQKALSSERHTLLDALVGEHLKQHSNDPEKSLAAVSSVGSLQEDLRQIADSELQASLIHVSAARQADEDPYGTKAPSAGTPTSTGLRFRILRPHAKGGLGQVSVAFDGELHREVALKEIQERYADHPESRSRFVQEAEITGGLEHPGIVPVYGLGSYADGRPFYAMRFIRGDSLKEAIERFHKTGGPVRDRGERGLELRNLLRRFLDVCNAIAYAHSRGVLHRDLKPGNIMLGKYGETLVVDWGLAKPVERKEAATTSDEPSLRPTSASGSAQTVAGSAIGTPQYMSPEQAAGRLDLLGPASDVYSLGATLYCLLTGKAPFGEADVGQLLQKVQQGAFPRPRVLNPYLPKPLEAICLKAMAGHPPDRYVSPDALAKDLERWLADEPVHAWRESRWDRGKRWMRRHPKSLTAFAVMLLALSVGQYVFREWRAERDARRLGVLVALQENVDQDAAVLNTYLEILKDDVEFQARRYLLQYLSGGQQTLKGLPNPYSYYAANNFGELLGAKHEYLKIRLIECDNNYDLEVASAKLRNAAAERTDDNIQKAFIDERKRPGWFAAAVNSWSPAPFPGGVPWVALYGVCREDLLYASPSSASWKVQKEDWLERIKEIGRRGEKPEIDQSGKGQIYLSNIEKTTEWADKNQKPLLVIHAAMPVYNRRTQAFYGILVIDANFSSVVQALHQYEALLKAQRRSEPGTAGTDKVELRKKHSFITDHEGNILFADDKEKTGLRLQDRYPELAQAFSAGSTHHLFFIDPGKNLQHDAGWLMKIDLPGASARRFIGLAIVSPLR